jgi:hypothetical protein
MKPCLRPMLSHFNWLQALYTKKKLHEEEKGEISTWIGLITECSMNSAIRNFRAY